ITRTYLHDTAISVAIHSDNLPLPRRPIPDGGRTGKRRRMRDGRPSAGVGPAALQDNGWLPRRCLPQRPNKRPAVSHALDISADYARLGVLREILEEIALVNVERIPVADRVRG